MNLAWLLAAVFFVVSTLLTETALSMVANHPAMKRLQMTPCQIQMAIESNAMDKDEFIEDMVSLLRDILTAGNPQHRGVPLHSGHAQRFVRRLIIDSFPKVKIRDFDPATGGKDHLEDIAQWVVEQGTKDEQDMFHQRYPHIPLVPGWSVDTTLE